MRRRAELCFKYLLAALRGVYRNTAVISTVAQEAMTLLKRLDRRTAEAEQEYLVRADHVVSAHFDLWGERADERDLRAEPLAAPPDRGAEPIAQDAEGGH